MTAADYPPTVQPIVSAGERDLPDLVDVPDMREAITGMSRPMTLTISSIFAGPGGDAATKTRTVQTNGFLTASTAQKLKVKEDGSGTRTWRYWALYCLNNPEVRLQDSIAIDGIPYQVVAANDRSQHGYFQIGLSENFR